MLTLGLWLTSFLLLSALLLGVVRVWRGPTLADRMLAAQLFGTTGVGLLLIQAELMALPGLRDVALVLALLAIMASVAFVARTQASATPDDKRETPGGADDVD